MKAKLAPPKTPPPKVLRKAPHRPVRVSVPTPEFTSTRTSIQPSLTVGPAHDPLEREADAMAERVVSMPSPALSESPTPPAAPPGQNPAPPPAPASPPTGQVERVLHRDLGGQPNLDSLDDQPALEAHEQEPTIDESEDIAPEDLSGEDIKALENVDKMPSGSKDPDTKNEAPDAGGGAQDADIQAKHTLRRNAVMGAEGGTAPSDVAHRVHNPGAGRPLPASVRGFMEPRFGQDFSDVRIHDEAQDHATAAKIGARAFTYKNRIWMGRGESVENKRLMAHELTHVVQQTKRKAAPPKAHAQRVPTPSAAAPSVQRGWVADKAESYARQVPGYTLVCVLLGKSPITGRRVTRNATNIIGGFLGLIPGGTYVFDKLKEAKVIQDAYTWVKTRLSQLNLTWSRVKGLIKKAIDVFPTWSPLESIKKIFAPLIRDIKTFAREIKDKVLSFIIKGALKLAGPYGDKIWKFIKKAGNIISLIFNNPIGFAKNLIKGVVGGFKLFGRNILDHLKRGLLGWLFGALATAGLELPQKLDIKGMLSIGLQVIGLSYDKFRTKLAKRLNPHGERKVGFMEKGIGFLKTLATKGFLGIWKKTLSLIEGFKKTLIGGISKVVIVSVIEAGIGWLAGLSNPIGAIFKVIKAVYDFVKVFLERFDEIVSVATTIFNSIGAIAAGNTANASKLVEKAIGATVPVIISFMASFFGLGGITKKIQGVIKSIQKPVAKGMTKLISFLVKKAKKFLAKLMKKFNKKKGLPKKPFKLGKTTHHALLKKKGRKIKLYFKSELAGPKEVIKEVSQAQADATKDDNKDDAKELGALKKEFEFTDKQVSETLALINKRGTKPHAPSRGKAAEERMAKATKTLGTLGARLADDADTIITEDNERILRYSTAKSDAEGRFGTYSEMSDIITKLKEKPGGQNAGQVYNIDHNPPQSMSKILWDWLHQQQNGSDKSDPLRTQSGAGGGAPAAAAPINFGLVFGPKESNPAGGALSYPSMIISTQKHIKKKKKDEHEGLITSLIKQGESYKPVTPELVGQVKQVMAQNYIPKVLGDITYKEVEGEIRKFKERILFDFQLTGAPSAKPASTGVGQDPSLEGGGLTFAGLPGKPESHFLKHEGRLYRYGSLFATGQTVGSSQGLLSLDHNIPVSFIYNLNGKNRSASGGPGVELIGARLWEKNYPLTQASSEADAAREDNPSIPSGADIAALYSRPIYAATSEVGRYHEKQELALSVVSRTNTRGGSVTASTYHPNIAQKSGGVTPIQDYVKGNKTQLQVRQAVADAVSGLVQTGFEENAKSTLDEYQKEVGYVDSLQKTAADKRKAKGLMTKIISDIRQSQAFMRTRSLQIPKSPD